MMKKSPVGLLGLTGDSSYCYLFSKFAIAEPPVLALDVSFFYFFLTIGYGVHVVGGGYEYLAAEVVVGRPVGGHGAFVFVGCLEGFKDAEYLVDVASCFLGVHELEADYAFVVDDVDGSDCVGALGGVDHAELLGHYAEFVGDYGEGDFDVEFFLYPFCPLDVGEYLVDGEADE